MSARRLRFRTSLLLLQEYGPTMTTDQVRDRFLPGLTRRTIDNWVSRGDLPPRINGVFDTQQMGDWWDSVSPAGVAPVPEPLKWGAGTDYAEVVSKAKQGAIAKHTPTVYMLLKGEEVVYVGMSGTPFVRISIHVSGNKDFDSVAMIQCEPGSEKRLESILIAMLRPKYNIAGMPIEA